MGGIPLFCNNAMIILKMLANSHKLIIHSLLRIYRDGIKGGPVLLSNSQSGPGRDFSQPRAQLLVAWLPLALGARKSLYVYACKT